MGPSPRGRDVPKLTQRVFRLRFPDDPEFDALAITTRSVPLGTLMDATALGAELDVDLSDHDAVRAAVTPKDAAGTLVLFEQFADALVSWELEEDDPERPGELRRVPPTLAGIRSQDVGHMLSIVNVWLDAVLGRLESPLSNGSSAGGRSEPPPLPMASPTPSLVN